MLRIFLAKNVDGFVEFVCGRLYFQRNDFRAGLQQKIYFITMDASFFLPSMVIKRSVSGGDYLRRGVFVKIAQVGGKLVAQKLCVMFSPALGDASKIMAVKSPTSERYSLNVSSS